MTGKEAYEGEERRGNSRTAPESNLTVRWWCILLVFLGIFGYFFLSILNHETRITRNETRYEAMVGTLNDIKADTKDIRDKVYKR